jgi:integrase
MKSSVWLAKRKNKSGYVWHLKWINPTTGGTRSVSTKTKDKRRADILRSKKIDQLRRGEAGEVRKVTWSEFVDEAIERIQATSKPATVRDLKHTAAAFEQLIRPFYPHAVKDGDVLRFLDAKAKDGLSNATRDKHRRNLVWLFNEGIKAGVLTKNPASGVRRLKAAEKDWHLYTDAEIDRLLAVADEKTWGPMVYLAYTTGLRRGEIENLIWTDIDLDQMTIAVNAKDGKDGTIAWQPKDYERRIVPLTEYAGHWLRKLRMASDPGNPYLFIPPQRYAHLIAGGGGRNTINNFNREWATLCKRAEVPKCQFHSLRKSCITRWLEKGVPSFKVKEQAGHSSIQTTERYYIKFRSGDVEQAREASSEYRPTTRFTTRFANGA